MADSVPQAQIIPRLSDAVYSSFALLAGMQLDLFTPLKDGPLDLGALAQRLEVQPAKLGPLLYALVGIGLLTVNDGRFANTAEAACFLVQGQPEYLGERHYLWSQLWPAALQTAASIRTGVPQAKVDFSAAGVAQLEGFLRGLHPAATAAGRAFGRARTVPAGARVLDVAGGSGGFALGLAEVRPDLRVTVAELPQVAVLTRQFVQQAGVQAVTVVEANLVQQPVAGEYAVAVLKNFLQVLAAEQAAQALRHVYKALKPGGQVFIMGDILHDSRLEPLDTVAFNLVFLNVYDHGQAYTQSEYFGWLAAAGFEAIESIEPELLSARKPD